MKVLLFILSSTCHPCGRNQLPTLEKCLRATIPKTCIREAYCLKCDALFLSSSKLIECYEFICDLVEEFKSSVIMSPLSIVLIHKLKYLLSQGLSFFISNRIKTIQSSWSYPKFILQRDAGMHWDREVLFDLCAGR